VHLMCYQEEGCTTLCWHRLRAGDQCPFTHTCWRYLLFHTQWLPIHTLTMHWCVLIVRFLGKVCASVSKLHKERIARVKKIRNDISLLIINSFSPLTISPIEGLNPKIVNLMFKHANHLSFLFFLVLCFNNYDWMAIS